MLNISLHEVSQNTQNETEKRVMGALNEVLQQTVFTQKQKLQQNKSIYKKPA